MNLAFHGTRTFVVFGVHTNIFELGFRPTQGLSVEFCESGTLELVTNDSDFGRKMASVFPKTSDGEQKILVGV